jgi:hypothetical protein|tara:strand:- start:141 stop:338 length:198 start_codon:yes stop_codon:yes gene_type:complete
MDVIYVAEAVFRIIKERRDAVADLMVFGNVKSMEHYRELMGNLDALNHVERELKGLLDKQERSDD